MVPTNEFALEQQIAYFSMEIGFKSDIPTYSGGLGVLAGDMIRSAVDLNLPMTAVTLVYRKGYFRQELDGEGRQTERPDEWRPEDRTTPLKARIKVRIEGRDVYVQAWEYRVESPVTGWKVPIILLDTNLPENSPEDRAITDHLYGGDDRYRLKQEVVLGIGGVLMLRALGIGVKKYHMNEGHAGLLTLELLSRHKKDIESVWDERYIWDTDRVKELCVFTTHTPVEAGHDKFSYELVGEVMGEVIPLNVLKELGGKDKLNLTLLAMNLSKYINGVAKKHGEVSNVLFPGYKIQAITNGVHSATWTCESFARLFDKYLPGWANEPELFVRIEKIPDEEVWEAHRAAKKRLIDHVNKATGAGMDCETLTIGFARRATAYKRSTLVFSDIERLKRICGKRLQIIFAGKAHPRDFEGKRNIEGIFSKARALGPDIRTVYLPNYDMDLAHMLVSGVDVWLNTPMRPREASGTSGMKAAHNAVLNLSVLDGWWIEGHIEGYTGWSIGAMPTETTMTASSDAEDAEDLYRKLERQVLPAYYENRSIWIKMMKNAVGKNAYYFNSHRMMRRYVTEAYIR